MRYVSFAEPNQFVEAFRLRKVSPNVPGSGMVCELHDGVTVVLPPTQKDVWPEEGDYLTFTPELQIERKDPQIRPREVFETLYRAIPQDFIRATELTPEVVAGVEDAFEYHAWTADQAEAGKRVRRVLADAVLQIIRDVPPGPDRTTAIRKIREARMDANSAITHGGKY